MKREGEKNLGGVVRRGGGFVGGWRRAEKGRGGKNCRSKKIEGGGGKWV